MILKDKVVDITELLIDDYTVVSKRQGKRKIEYVNLACGFDIETSSFYTESGCKAAIMYVWQLGIDGKVMVGRTWEEFKDALKIICQHYDISSDRHLVVYVHNLPYEFQWIRRHFDWESIFAREERKPMKAVTVEGIEFRCSYIYTGLGLEKSCEQLTKYKMKKQVGDLDYRLVRTPLTKLNKKELGYCIYDVLGVMAIIQEAIEMYGDITKIPMTNTGKVRRYCQEHCLSKDVNGKRYRELIHSLNINGTDEYNMLKRAFSGGFTHANYRRVNKKFSDVKSFDYTSSYPAVMVSERFPMSTGKHRTDLTYDEIKNSDNLFIFNCKFINIREKPQIPDHYLSLAKCFNVSKPKVDNGRVISAKELITTITDVDLEVIDKCYDYDEIIIGGGYSYIAAYLPKELINCILDFYEKKTTLKDVDGEEGIYQLFKGMLNSCYGMTVTDIVSNTVVYVDDWGTEQVSPEEEIENYNKARNRFLFYPWGVFVTAYARRNLWTGIIECGQDYIYADTDSVKILNYEVHKDYFEKYNEDIIKKLYTTCDRLGISRERIAPKTIKGKEKPLGVWDDDGSYKFFKTLGAKRYLVEYYEPYKVEIDGKEVELTHKCTVAGVNKYKTSQFLESFDDPFGAFTDELTVDEEHSGRLISTYLDGEEGEYKGAVADYNGVWYTYSEQSCIHMEQSLYHLSMGAEYLALVLGTYLREEGEIG